MKNLKHITDQLLLATTPAEIEFSGAKLCDFFKSLNKCKVFGEENIYTKNGIAISPHHAADCMKEYIRTVKLIQGVKSALDTLPIKTITYAGCGVYAPLLLSVLHYYSKNQFKITIIDISSESLDSVKKLINEIGYEDYDIKLVQGDASEIKLPETDLLICECMMAGLRTETQLGIFRNIDFKISIPEEIQLTLSDYDFDSKTDYSKEQDLCTINKNNLDVTGCVIDTSKIQKKLCIHTRVKIFENILLDRNESSITNSFIIYKSDTYTKLSFQEKPMPKWLGEKVII